MPMSPTARGHCAAIALGMSVAFAQSAAAQFHLPECTCENLTSLQQDFRNAVTLAEYFQGLADHLEAVEAEERAKFPEDPERVEEHVGSALSRYLQENPPSQRLIPVHDYVGPSSVEMAYGTCTQDAERLLQMELGSPCRAMADASLNHEAFHRDTCSRMGPEAYWNQSRVANAREEVAAYRAQAADLREEIRRVLEAAEVIYKSDSSFDLNVQGMAQYGYVSSARSEDIGHPSDGDTWTMIGRGSSTGKCVKAVIVGMTCTPKGMINSRFDLTLTTDGLVFDLEVGEIVTSGAMSIICRGAGSSSGPVSAVTEGPGMITSGQPLRTGDNPLPSDMTDEVRAQLSSVGTVTFEGESVLSVTCSAP
ncbi:hypothetical protein [Marimonas arenosa]|uniref:Uncharacterized protein n=1 Tax=Marimonas arenosa TaxID=1795305 RepID=A0AAE3WEJ5_9RHOB|nr:hypothetical protein [Marimonas arenosa]MDQ2090915.1 hypothetical protein [Marimonas arenosa]